MITVFADKYGTSWPPKPGKDSRPSESLVLPLGQALSSAYATDAHFTAYESVAAGPPHGGPYLRLSKRALAPEFLAMLGGGIRINAIVFDLDDPLAHAQSVPARPEWLEQTRAKLERLVGDNPAARAYQTRGGFRVVGALPAGWIVLKSPDDAHRWWAFHDAWRTSLERRYGLNIDPQCKDFTRYYRLPYVVRDGVEQVFPTVGDLASVGEWQPPPDAIDAAKRYQAKPSVTIPAGLAEKLPKDVQEHRAPLIAQLIAPCFVRGHRHALSMALAGFMHKQGFDADVILPVIRGLPSDDPEARVRDAQDAIDAGAEAAGYTALSSILHPDVLGRLEQLCAPLNAEHSMFGRFVRAAHAKLGRACKEIKAINGGMGEAAEAVALRHAFELGRIVPHFLPYQHVVDSLLGVCERRYEETLRARLEAGMGRPHNPLEDWRASLTYGPEAQVIPTLNTLQTVLLHAPEWDGVFGFDLFEGRNMLLKPPPFDADYYEADATLPRQWKDVDDSRTAVWFEREWSVTPQINDVVRAVDTVARAQSFDSLLDHLGSLTWDGQTRLDTWLVRYGAAEDCPYVRTIGRKWLIQVIARAYASEHCPAQADSVLVLEGDQGARKTSLLRTLAGKWYRALGSDVRSKDALLGLRRAWIVEAEELDSLSRSDLNAVKAFITRMTDDYRVPYGKRDESFVRRCAFAGSTNEEQYLTDMTGNRRFWGVLLRHVDIEALRRDRDKLLAEARMAYLAGLQPNGMPREFLWWLTPEEKRIADSEAEARRVRHPWEDAIETYLETGRKGQIYATDSKPPTRTTIREILKDVLCLEIGRLGGGHTSTVGKILTKLGWEKKRDAQGTREWFYEPGPRSAIGRPAHLHLVKDHP